MLLSSFRNGKCCYQAGNGAPWLTCAGPIVPLMWHSLTALGDGLYAYEVHHMPKLSQTLLFSRLQSGDTKEVCGRIGSSSD